MKYGLRYWCIKLYLWVEGQNEQRIAAKQANHPTTRGRH